MTEATEHAFSIEDRGRSTEEGRRIPRRHFPEAEKKYSVYQALTVHQASCL